VTLPEFERVAGILRLTARAAALARRVIVERAAVADVAQQFGMRPAAVHAAVGRVSRAIHQRYEAEREEDDPAPTLSDPPDLDAGFEAEVEALWDAVRGKNTATPDYRPSGSSSTERCHGKRLRKEDVRTVVRRAEDRRAAR
jgi:hypothetical protein